MAIGIMIVVFCHVPQYNSLEKTFLCYLQMPLFFFISGFLHNVPSSIKQSFLKYYKTIIVPYLLFQFISYPYWILKQISQGSDISNIYQIVILPFAQSIYGIPINGITWFLVALFLIKMILDLLVNSSHENLFIFITLVLSFAISYVIWSDSIVNVSFAIDSLFSFYPFFIIGYFFKVHFPNNKTAEEGTNYYKQITLALSLLVVNILSIIFIPTEKYLVSRLLFYFLGITGSFFIIELSKTINFIPRFVMRISEGTIIILGMHWMFIGTMNKILKKILGLNGEIMYSTFEAVLLVLFITYINYYIIKFCKLHFKALLGGRG